MAEATYPASDQKQDAAAPHIIVTPFYKDPVTGALYVHKDLDLAAEAWKEREEQDGYIPPIERDEAFGDAESWASYVTRFGQPPTVLLTWNSKGLRAILDYHPEDELGTPGRCKWKAHHAFRFTPEWEAWRKFADGSVHTQAQVIEHLETYADTVLEPEYGNLLTLLRELRTSVKLEAATSLQPNGSVSVAFKKDNQVIGPKGLDIPAELTIGVPVLSGHVDAEGKPVAYKVKVRLRPTVQDSGPLTFRLALQQTERVVEMAVKERVEAARAILGEEFSHRLLRAAESS